MRYTVKLDTIWYSGITNKAFNEEVSAWHYYTEESPNAEELAIEKFEFECTMAQDGGLRGSTIYANRYITLSKIDETIGITLDAKVFRNSAH